ncbi:MAG: DUF4147 domain-containing protein [Leptospiraceae bacterium]|nr:DUF4147 domain-containing protein [Leptospiraceae bacterium]MDW7976943.1 DUF4147 domain-containing protein [Leptospiraceae bacterium]
MNHKSIIQKIIQEIYTEIRAEKLLKNNLKENKFIQLIEKSKIYVISLGKAGFSMAKAFFEYLQENDFDGLLGGCVVTPYRTKTSEIANFEIIESSHPYPDHNSLYAGERLWEIAHSLPHDVVIVFLLSGGASALVEKPIEGMGLTELQELTNSLLKSGASIQEINTIRKKFSYLKGGGVAELLYPRVVYQFLLNDVVGINTEKHVSSGLLYPEEIPFRTVQELMEKYQVKTSFDLSKLSFPEKKRTSLKKTFLVGNNEIACIKAKEILESHGFSAFIKRTQIQSTLEEYEKEIQKSIQALLKEPRHQTAHLWGGEPTLKVTGKGKGGRNQELALRIAIFFEHIKTQLPMGYEWGFVSMGTDGVDGPTDAAGAIVDPNTYSTIYGKTQKSKLPEAFLQENDSYHALLLSDSLIKVGYTGTNLNDLAILFVF